MSAFAPQNGKQEAQGQKHHRVQPELQEKSGILFIAKGDEIYGGVPANILNGGNAHHIEHSTQVKGKQADEKEPFSAPGFAEGHKKPGKGQREHRGAQQVDNSV